MAIRRMALAAVPLPNFKKGVPPFERVELEYKLPLKFEPNAYKRFGFKTHRDFFNWAEKADARRQRINPTTLVVTQDEVNETTVKEIAAALLTNKRLEVDAIRVAFDGKNYYVIDGHHRLAAYLAVGRKWIPMEVVQKV